MELYDALNPSKEPDTFGTIGSTRTYYGVATSDSVDGYVSVMLDGTTVAEPELMEETSESHHSAEFSSDGSIELQGIPDASTLLITDGTTDADGNAVYLDAGEYDISGSTISIDALSIVRSIEISWDEEFSETFADGGSVTLAHVPKSGLSVTDKDGVAVQYEINGSSITVDGFAGQDDVSASVQWSYEMSETLYPSDRMAALSHDPDAGTIRITTPENDGTYSVVTGWSIDGRNVTFGSDIQSAQVDYNVTASEAFMLSELIGADNADEGDPDQVESIGYDLIYRIPNEPIVYSVSVTLGGEPYQDWTLSDNSVSFAWRPTPGKELNVSYVASVMYAPNQAELNASGSIELAGTPIDGTVSVLVNDSESSFTIEGRTVTIPTAAREDKTYTITYSPLLYSESIELPTTCSVIEEDAVIVTVVDGIPKVTGTVGEGDRQDDAISAADQKATQAAADAGNASVLATAAHGLAESASASASQAIAKAEAAESGIIEAKQSAAMASIIANDAKSAVAPIVDEFDAVRQNASNAAASAESIKSAVEYEYAKKTDLTESYASMRTEQSQTAYGWVLNAYYSAKANATDNATPLLDAAKESLDSASNALDSASSALASANDELAQAADALNAASESLASASVAQDSARYELSKANNELADANRILAEAQASGNQEAISAAQTAVADAQAIVTEAQSALDAAVSDVSGAQSSYESTYAGYVIASNAVSTAKAAYDSANVDYMTALNGLVEQTNSQLSINADSLRFAISDASTKATDYLQFTSGGLEIGDSSSQVRMRLTSEQLQFVTDGSVLADFGKVDKQWQMDIANASITDMLKFGSFAWIRRSNGNMSLKWIGGVNGN